MSGQKNNTLRYVSNLLAEDKSDEARQLLITYIKRVPDSAEAWWLLCQTIEDEEQLTDSLERVLHLDPNHIPARNVLEKLQNPFSAPAEAKPESPFSIPLDDESDVYQPTTESASAFAFEEEDDDGSLPSFLSDEALPEKELKTSRSTPSKKRTPAKKKKNNKWVIALVLIVFCLGIMGIAYFGWIIIKETGGNPVAPSASPTTVLSTQTPVPPRSLPPTWTPTPSLVPPPSRTPIPTIAPFETASPIN